MHPMLNIAVRAARKAGDQILRAGDNVGKLKIRHKTLNDLVSEVDQNAEETIKAIRLIRKDFPYIGASPDNLYFEKNLL